MFEFILIATLTYGLMMGAHLSRYADTLGVRRVDIFCALGTAYFAAICGWIGFFLVVLLVAMFQRIGFSWQMHRSYPTDPRFKDIYIKYHGRIR